MQSQYLRVLAAMVAALASPGLSGCVPPPGNQPDGGVTPTVEPWITVAANKRYFAFDDGTSFFPLGTATSGEQMSLDYFGTVTLDGKTVTFDPAGLEKRFQEMQANGENLLRIDIEATGWWRDPDLQMLIDSRRIQFLEDPVGTFNEDYARRIDHVLTLAKTYGIYLDFVLLAHTCQLEGLDDNLRFYPYHRSQGGPLDRLGDFVTSADAKERFKSRIRSIVDRWGSSSQIFNWELWNEMTGCGGSGNNSNDAAWVEEMGKYLKDYERSRYGKSHLVSVSATGYLPSPIKAFFLNPGTDIAMHHFYPSGVTSLANPVELSKTLRQMLQTTLEQTVAYSRPLLENERLNYAAWPDSVSKEGEHMLIWTYLASGSAGGGATWVPFPRYVPDTGDRDRAGLVAGAHKVVRGFVNTIDLTSFNSRNFNHSVSSSNPGIVATATSDRKTLIGWLMHDNPLDYQIDYVNALRTGPLSNVILDIEILQMWYGLMKQEGVVVDLQPYLDQVSAILIRDIGITQAQADALAKQLFQAPNEVLGRHRQALKDAPPETLAVLMKDLLGLLTRIRTDFEALESQHHTLERLYSDHPEVSTTLTISGLCQGPHQIQWIDDNTGALVREASASGERFQVTSPAFRRHLALLIRSGC